MRTHRCTSRCGRGFSAVVVVALAAMIAGALGCSDPPDPLEPATTGGLRVVNAFTAPVDVLIDGRVAIASLPPSAIATAAPASGAHTLTLRPTGSPASVSHSITTTTGATSTIAAVRLSDGAVASVTLDDTSAVVPPGATKLRVLHLAPNAGALQVYRTQPDYNEPTLWQLPFEYQSEPGYAPFFQSTVGTWELRAWKTPSDQSGWATAAATIIVPLNSGEKATVLILDAPSGGIRFELM